MTRASKGSKKSDGPSGSSVALAALPVQIVNNVRIYNVSGYAHHKLPDWVVRKNAKKLKKDAGWRQRVQLVQDFEFPEASLRLAYTPDGQYLVAAGVYKPQFRVYDLAEMTLKFERHTSAETVGMQVLSEDWRKLVLLQADRTVEFHGGSGVYHSVRIPRAGRSLLYDPVTCDLVIGASSSSVYRLNLDRGQFMAPFDLEILEAANLEGGGVNDLQQNPLHGLYGFACDGGIVEFWDRRVRERVAGITLAGSEAFSSTDAHSLAFLPDGLGWAVGTGDGRMLQFDLRSSRPLSIRDHHNGQPVKRIVHHAASHTLIAADRKAIKFWRVGETAENDHSRGALMTAIEPSHDINDFCIDGKSGLVLAAVEDKTVSSFFIPELGPAPRWCSFLENVTEEMEERAPASAAIYDNYKFVSRSDLSALGLDHLVGTDVLRAYMHGYFIDLRLYEKAKAIANPFAYDQYLAKQREARLEAERASRIRASNPAKPSVKVNRKLASKLLETAATVESVSLDQESAQPRLASDKKKAMAAAAASTLLRDSRFAPHLFNDPDFEIDEESPEFRLVHPSDAPKRRKED